MANQFKHESDEYIPLVSSEGSEERPWWMAEDELIIYFEGENDTINFDVIKIYSLSAEEFIKYQEKGHIPKDYKIEDWIK